MDMVWLALTMAVTTTLVLLHTLDSEPHIPTEAHKVLDASAVMLTQKLMPMQLTTMEVTMV